MTPIFIYPGKNLYTLQDAYIGGAMLIASALWFAICAFRHFRRFQVLSRSPSDPTVIASDKAAPEDELSAAWTFVSVSLIWVAMALYLVWSKLPR